MKLRAPRSILIGSGVLGGIAVLPIVARAQNSTASTSSNADYEPLGIDGSGTTNPSKCFWHIMSKFNEQIKLPTQFSYRAVGSGTGIKEFLGKGIEIDGVESDTYLPYNDFGSGDIPISAEDRSDASSRGIEFVQLPFALSAVSFFHSVPGVPSGEMGLSEFLIRWLEFPIIGKFVMCIYIFNIYIYISDVSLPLSLLVLLSSGLISRRP
jgi:ABC-type phosphate transport system substrate-binding protein